ncbi:tubulin-like doman-containing protein [Synechococcus sp. PCC 6716]|nr:tubulin-like doman-containing protein [Synechococcus sp. PCC 6716]
MSNYIIAIGGTGARVVESFIHIASTGIFGSEEIKIIFIDPDESNGNLQRSLTSLNQYSANHQLMATSSRLCPWVQTPIGAMELWSPFHGMLSRSLGQFFNYEKYKVGGSDAPLGHLFDVLYTQQEREANLDVGFRGRPAIGSAIMSQLNLEERGREPWHSLIQQIEQNTSLGKFPKIFLCGSIFGGTGASGFPTIGRLLKNRLQQQGLTGRVKMGGLLVLPYFQFIIPADSDNEVCARPEQFLLNTEAALRYYRDRSIFDTIYLLGEEQLNEVGRFSLGKNTQCNDPHFIEFLGALSIFHFFNNQDVDKVAILHRSEQQQVTWQDIPDREAIQSNLRQATLFSYLWLSAVRPQLKNTALSDLLRFAPWTNAYYKLGRRGIFGFGGVSLPEVNDPQEQQALAHVTDYCTSYIKWLATMLRSGKNHVNLGELFPLYNLNPDPSKLTLDGIIGLTRSWTASPVTADILLQKVTEIQPSSQGTVGLVNSLYTVCNI